MHYQLQYNCEIGWNNNSYLVEWFPKRPNHFSQRKMAHQRQYHLGISNLLSLKYDPIQRALLRDRAWFLADEGSRIVPDQHLSRILMDQRILMAVEHRFPVLWTNKTIRDISHEFLVNLTIHLFEAHTKRRRLGSGAQRWWWHECHGWCYQN